MGTAATQSPGQHTDDTAPPQSSGSLARPVAAVVVGLVLLIAAFAVLGRIPQWADRYGAIWVYLGFFVVMSIAGRLFWQGADKLVERMRSGGSTSTPAR
ncbi:MULTISPECIES: hypothetical protein [unclassified Nocardia]|uniref:hypothetical protein n=1 Tax=unclassified Nocardia TaxID=2637762 RepID=UPI00278C58AD|nr:MULTISPECIES: hypothetical protein [unclassified Nocardia]